MEVNELAKIVEDGFKRMDAKFEHLDAKFASLDAKFTGRIDKLEARVEDLADAVHQNGIQIEHLRGEIQAVAEGVSLVNEKLDRHIADRTIHLPAH